MPNEERLIPDPLLDDRSEAKRVADRMHRTLPNLTEDDAQLIIDYGEELLAVLKSSGAVSDPLMPELTSARPAEAHMTLIREIERAYTFLVFKLNIVPDKVRIALLRLVGVEMIPAIAATTTLQFTKTEDFLGVEVVIPAGSEVTDEARELTVFTKEDLVIAADVLSGQIQATNSTEGDIGRVSPGTMSLLVTSIPGIESVTNTVALTGGAAAETVEQAEIRAREEFRIGEHLGSADDYINHIYFQVLRRKGRVTAFEQYRSDLTLGGLGYLLLMVQGADGLAPSSETLDQVAAVINERHVAGIVVAARPPGYKDFDLAIQVRVASGQSASTLINRAKQNLAGFYNPLRFPFGPEFPARSIELSDIVGQVEAAGASLISVASVEGRHAITITSGGESFQEDVPLLISELPRLGAVAITQV